MSAHMGLGVTIAMDGPTRKGAEDPLSQQFPERDLTRNDLKPVRARGVSEALGRLSHAQERKQVFL